MFEQCWLRCRLGVCSASVEAAHQAQYLSLAFRCLKHWTGLRLSWKPLLKLVTSESNRQRLSTVFWKLTPSMEQNCQVLHMGVLHHFSSYMYVMYYSTRTTPPACSLTLSRRSHLCFSACPPNFVQYQGNCYKYIDHWQRMHTQPARGMFQRCNDSS